MGVRAAVVVLLRRARIVGPEPPRPTGPPLEVLARDVRRLGARFHAPPPGSSFCKIDAVRFAYDRALARCADALEVDHLLGVLAPGDHLDRERARVERALHCWGVRLADAI